MRTSFHHRPEAQHPNSSAIHKLAGRLPHLSGGSCGPNTLYQGPPSSQHREHASLFRAGRLSARPP